MNKIWLLSKFELKNFFSSSNSGFILFIFLSLNGLFFYNSVTDYAFASLSAFGQSLTIDASKAVFSKTLSQMPLSLVVIIPMITMHSLSSGKKDSRFDLLNSLPISPYKIVLSQYLAISIILIVFNLLCLAPFIILILFGIGSLGMLLTSTIGLLILTLTFVAISLAISASCTSAPTAGTFSLVTLGCLWGMGWAAPYLPNLLANFADLLSLENRTLSFFLGTINLNDLFFLLLSTVIALVISNLNLKARVYA